MKAEKTLRARAIDLLSRREHSRRELERKLAPFAGSPEELTELLDELAQRAWQSDERAAAMLARTRGQKYGSLRLRQELREKGIASEAIDAALAGQDDAATARAAWERKFGALPETPEARARQIRFLAARGFSMDVIRTVLAGAADDLCDDGSG
ncbi:recombination regulator RecX [Paludibacterium yongneupense]|uniref:recombination regulator RecX n=1 Tax=Paludibacterium yongneupense TaxID=400061 RepID=UPI000413A7BD|nr:recombination regulator RecX [Paludibacterium yongneupense]